MEKTAGWQLFQGDAMRLVERVSVNAAKRNLVGIERNRGSPRLVRTAQKNLLEKEEFF